MDSVIWGISGFMMGSEKRGWKVILWDTTKMIKLVGRPTRGGEWPKHSEVVQDVPGGSFHKYRKMIGAVDRKHNEAFEAWFDKRHSPSPLPFPLGEMNRKPWTKLGE